MADANRLIGKNIRRRLFVCGAGLLLLMAARGYAESEQFDRMDTWQGYSRGHFRVAGRPAYLVRPKVAAPGKPWVWRARFPSYHAEMDVALLGKGFHIAYVDVAGMFGGPEAMRIGDAFYTHLTEQTGLAKKPALEGVSRGGLFVYNWAARNPDKVACIYCDTPVLDFKSWPGGKGDGLGAPAAWKQCLDAYGLTEAEALAHPNNPVDRAVVVAKAKIPSLHIVSENDRVVPPAENTYLLRKRLQELGNSLEIISVPQGTEKSNGHHFDHPEPSKVVAFIQRHAGLTSKDSDTEALLLGSKRILFLGDSITYSGKYIGYFDLWLTLERKANAPVVLNAGLPSETVSGLSEEGHAGGRFPRPDLAKRLDRILAVAKPDLVIACYGINCGIYQPFDEARFRAYQQGMRSLKQKTEAAGAMLVVVTPPAYDDQRAKKSFSYNDVLDQYAAWLLAQRESGWHVIDLHGPMTRELAKRREADPKFTFQPDAVHPNEEGHWYIAARIIQWFGGAEAASMETPQAYAASKRCTKNTRDLLFSRMAVRRDAYLTAAGHERPGIRKGQPLDQAEARAQQLTLKILDAIP